MRRTDVLVVGAGPAGTAAAIGLRRQGRDVVVIDKATFPRDKCCGDGLTTEALRLLEDLGVQPEGVSNWNAVTDIVITSPRGRQVQLPLPTDGQFAAVVPRADLDHSLVQLAESAGATVVQGTSFDSLEELDDRVRVTTSTGETIDTRYVIAADGMWSPVRRSTQVGPASYRGEWHAFRQYFCNVGPQAQHLVVWFEPDLLPGYAWSFPLPGQRANVGFGINRGAGIKVGDMKQLWTDLLSRPHIRAVLGADAEPEDRHKAWPIPARVDQLPAAAGRVLFVGDAIGATDPMTGEGIAQALMTGMAAAEALSVSGPYRPDVAARHYKSRLSHELIPDHRMARALAKVLRTSTGTRGALRAADLTPWTRRNFARWMFEDYPRALIVTPRRWRRGALTGPGAYRNQQPSSRAPSPAKVTANR